MTGEIQHIEGAELLTAPRKSYPGPSPELGEWLRKTSMWSIDDYRLNPVPSAVYREIKEFLTAKYGAFVTRDSVMLNGHIMIEESGGDVSAIGKRK